VRNIQNTKNDRKWRGEKSIVMRKTDGVGEREREGESKLETFK
jgi:hypothetical protein